MKISTMFGYGIPSEFDAILDTQSSPFNTYIFAKGHVYVSQRTALNSTSGTLQYSFLQSDKSNVNNTVYNLPFVPTAAASTTNPRIILFFNGPSFVYYDLFNKRVLWSEEFCGD